MKTNSTSRAAPARRSLGEGGFFNSRLLIGFALCSVGLLLALAGLSKSVTGSTPYILFGHCEGTTHLNGYCITAINPYGCISRLSGLMHP